MFRDIDFLIGASLKIKIVLTFFVVGAVVFLLNSPLIESAAEKELREAINNKKMNPSKYVFDNFAEPPIPTVNGDILFGVDTNQNNIRDEIEIWINRKFDKKNERMATRQMAMDLTYLLQMAKENSTEKTSHASSIIYTTGQCLSFIFGYKKSEEVRDALIGLTFNTKKRDDFFQSINMHTLNIGSVVDGMLVGEGYKGCNFEIEDKDDLIKKYLIRKE